MTAPSAYIHPAGEAIRARRNDFASLMDNYMPNWRHRHDQLKASALATEV